LPVVLSGTYTFSYDGLENRITETGPSGSKTYTNTYVASGDAMLYLKNVVGTTTKTVYLYAGSLLVATVSGSTKSYFHEDHLGDTRLVTQAGRNGVSVVFSTNYEPFGKPYAVTGTEAYKYTGEKHDDPTGFVYLRARQYDPDLGRFVSADPVLGSLPAPRLWNRRRVNASGSPWEFHGQRGETNRPQGRYPAGRIPARPLPYLSP